MPQPPFHVYCNRRLAGILAVVMLVMTIFGYGLTTAPSTAPRWMGTIALVTCGGAFITMTRVLLIRGPVLTIDADGIHERELGYGHIPWPEIRNVHIGAIATRGDCLLVEVDHPATYLRRLWPHRRLLVLLTRLGSNDRELYISFGCVTPNADAAMDAVFAFKPPHVLAQRARCPGCGYDLRASPLRCPECGREVRAGNG